MAASLGVNFYVIGKLESLCHETLSEQVIVDFGCGWGRNGHLIRTYVDRGGSDAYLVGCDLFKKYLLETKRFNPYDELVVCDIRMVPFRFGVINHILASELIEHLSKEEGKTVLHQLCQLSDGSIILTTPYFPWVQGMIHGNPSEEHKSYWSRGDFEECGFETECRGFEELFRVIIDRLRLGNFLAKLNRLIWGKFMCFLIAYRKKKKA